MSDQRTTAERGYGSAHVSARRAYGIVVAAGRGVCSRCGATIVPGSPWDLDHTPDRLGYLGPAHRRCNRAAGARTGNRRRARRAAVIRAVTGNPSRSW